MALNTINRSVQVEKEDIYYTDKFDFNAARMAAYFICKVSKSKLQVQRRFGSCHEINK